MKEELSTSTSKITELHNEVIRTNSVVDVKNASLQEIEVKLSVSNKRIVELESLTKTQEDDNNLKQQELHQRIIVIDELNLKLADLQNDIQQKNQIVENLQNCITEQREALIDKDSKIATTQKVIDEQSVEMSRLEEVVARSHVTISENTEELSITKASIQNMSAELLALRETESACNQRIQILEEDVFQRDKTVNALQLKVSCKFLNLLLHVMDHLC